MGSDPVTGGPYDPYKWTYITWSYKLTTGRGLPCNLAWYVYILFTEEDRCQPTSCWRFSRIQHLWPFAELIFGAQKSVIFRCEDGLLLSKTKKKHNGCSGTSCWSWSNVALESQQLHGDDRRGLLSSEKSPNVIVGRCLWLWLLFFWYCYVFVDVLCQVTLKHAIHLIWRKGHICHSTLNPTAHDLSKMAFGSPYRNRAGHGHYNSRIQTISLEDAGNKSWVAVRQCPASLSCFMQLKESVAVACHCLDQTLHVTQGGPKNFCSAYLLSEATGRHVEIRCFSRLYHHWALPLSFWIVLWQFRLEVLDICDLRSCKVQRPVALLQFSESKKPTCCSTLPAVSLNAEIDFWWYTVYIQNMWNSFKTKRHALLGHQTTSPRCALTLAEGLPAVRTDGKGQHVRR